MQKKLTLTIEESLIQFAHGYAKQSQQSISKLVENFIQSLKNKAQDSELVSPKAQGLYGIFDEKPLPDKKTLRKYFYDQNHRRS